MKKLGVMFLFLSAFLMCLPASGMAFAVGDLSVGGAIRANYTIGDYAETDPSQPSRAEEDGGNFLLDTFRINLDYEKDDIIGKMEYRFYNDYHFLHTGWVGYNIDETSQIQFGVNRVPFGPGAYGVSQSWMFDQHYYVGLSDDMDLGAKYKTSIDNLALDFAYYFSDEGDYFGASNDSARYSYDVVDESENGYEEAHQFNVRAIYTIEGDPLTTDVGASLQYGLLDSNGSQDDGSHYAGSVHATMKMGNFKLVPQLTYYEYDVEADQPLGTDKLVYMGAYDYRTEVAAEAMIPAVSLSYYLETPQVEWLKYMIPYIEYSSIMKEESNFNDSDMLVVGSAWAHGGWYIYTDLAYSNGNDFVGNTSGWSRYGVNADDEWEYRFNINFGYYF